MSVSTLFILFVVILTTPLYSCSTGSMGDTLRARYVGYPVDSFYQQHGGPVSSYHSGKSGTGYMWISGRGSAYRPGTRGTVELIGNTDWRRGHSVWSYNPLLECRVEIYAGAEGRIYDMRLYGGERDWRHVQRCREVFGWGRS